MAFARLRSASAPAVLTPSAVPLNPHAASLRMYSSPNRQAGLSASVFVRRITRTLTGAVLVTPLAHWYLGGDGGCFATALYDVLVWMEAWQPVIKQLSTRADDWTAPRRWVALDPSSSSRSRFVYDIVLVEDEVVGTTGVGVALKDRADYVEYRCRRWSTAAVTRAWQDEMIRHHLLLIEHVDPTFAWQDWQPAAVPTDDEHWVDAMSRLWDAPVAGPAV